ncbi:acyltransferase [Rhizobium sp. CC-YZS058]|uniref:acyltransferase family protein n=1 Tax=Rhizobium sp. CC-YZS058 TaxID=3042153 RepID=UPI002B056FCE|nr:acyltransferase [Rhizobium sp. CC-YZS058]MEA3535451.1 acyltransferase [Rhizobium sp. CC-YZS058]
MNRLAHLDSLRGLAALSVIYYHVAEFALKTGKVSFGAEHALFALLTEWADLGKIAVAVFFAISGFVIPYSILKPREQPLKHFVISRFFRLYPAFWLSIPVGLLVLFVMLNRPFTLPMVLANLTMVQQFLGFPNIIGVYWTLQIELIFYAISAGLFVIGWLGKARMVAATTLLFLGAALLAAALRYWTGKSLPVAIPLGLTVMFWGLLWRYTLEQRENVRRLFIMVTAAIAVVLPPLCVLAYNFDTGFGETWYRYLISYYAAMALFVLFTARIRLTHPVLIYLGTISYSLYLFGPIGQELANILLGSAVERIPIHLFILLAMVFSIIMAALTYRFVEAPAIALGRRLSDRGIADRRQTA